MSEEEDEFQGLITHCLTVLLLGIETRLEGALGSMARLNWGTMEMVRAAGGGWRGTRRRRSGPTYLRPGLPPCPSPTPCPPPPAGGRPERVRGHVPPRAAGRGCAAGPRHAPQLLPLLLRQAAALFCTALLRKRAPLQEDLRRRLPAGAWRGAGRRQQSALPGVCRVRPASAVQPPVLAPAPTSPAPHPKQMRLDTEVIKGQLCDLAKAGGHLDAAGQQSFAADVHAQLGRAEAVLKASTTGQGCCAEATVVGPLSGRGWSWHHACSGAAEQPRRTHPCSPLSTRRWWGLPLRPWWTPFSSCCRMARPPTSSACWTSR